jgi:hypothetical protein
MKIYFPLLLIVLSVMACNRLNNKQKNPIARVYSDYLYREDLAGIFPQHISEVDSTRIARKFIDTWIRNQLLLRMAETNLPEKEKNLDKQIADFRASLLIYKYQQHLLAQKLDSLITFQEIETYYENHSNNFNLDRPAISGIYIKVPLDAPNRDRLLAWFRSGNDFAQIENYCSQYAVNYTFFYENWKYLDEILNELPPGSLGSASSLENLDHFRTSDSEYHYFLGIREYKPSRSPMPFSLASQNIKSIILNKRKIKFLNELEKNVFTEGLNKNAYQYF